jgi:hypothetical protein
MHWFKVYDCTQKVDFEKHDIIFLLTELNEE